MTPLARSLPLATIAAMTLVAPAAGSDAQPRSKLEPLDARVRAGIEEALQDELRGEAFYARVVKDHGDPRPFTNVVRAEARHAAWLTDLLETRGLAVPRAAATEAPAHASVKEACAAAVEFETKNVALYDRLLAAGALPDDVQRAFEHNRMASLDHHKPAFERCAGVVTAGGAGRGCDRSRGHGRECGHGGSGGACGHACGGGRCDHGPGCHGCGGRRAR